MAVPVPDDKLDHFGLPEKSSIDKNELAFHPGRVLPPKTDGFIIVPLLTRCNRVRVRPGGR